jgi:hypothetical protein
MQGSRQFPPTQADLRVPSKAGILAGLNILLWAARLVFFGGQSWFPKHGSHREIASSAHIKEKLFFY